MLGHVALLSEAFITDFTDERGFFSMHSDMFDHPALFGEALLALSIRAFVDLIDSLSPLVLLELDHIVLVLSLHNPLGQLSLDIPFLTLAEGKAFLFAVYF